MAQLQGDGFHTMCSKDDWFNKGHVGFNPGKEWTSN
jgi:hypothetical protein